MSDEPLKFPERRHVGTALSPERQRELEILADEIRALALSRGADVIASVVDSHHVQVWAEASEPRTWCPSSVRTFSAYDPWILLELEAWADAEG